MRFTLAAQDDRDGVVPVACNPRSGSRFRIGHANQRAIVESLAERNALRPGLSIDRAADILWTLNHPNLWQLLVGERGWTPDEHERWWSDTACAQLLRPRRPRKRSSAD